MERMAIELTFERSGKEYVEHCENFKITSTGYVAIDYFDGGYNCVYKANELKGAKMVLKKSVFPDMESYLYWKNAYNM